MLPQYTTNKSYRQAITKLRLTSHDLPIETGRYTNIPRNNRICPLCPMKSIGDELHILECSHAQITQIRHTFMQEIIKKCPQFQSLLPTHQLRYIMNAHDTTILLPSGQFISQVLHIYKENKKSQ